jgi:tRNA(fMet)-specific endonuclease VapC
MIYALDSDIVSYILKDDTAVTDRYFAELRNGNEFVIPPVVMYEIRRGLLAEKMHKRLNAFEETFQDIVSDDFGVQSWSKAADIYAALKSIGKPIGGKWEGDVFIAAYCIVNGYTLVTNNNDHFKRIDGLRFVNWKEGRTYSPD